MPWKRAKALPPPDNSLFEACFRIQREAIAASGRHVPLVVENVCGAQKWVGKARWRHGSYYLWGDVPALMPIVPNRTAFKGGDRNVGRANGTHKWNTEFSNPYGTKNGGGSWFRVAHNTGSGKGQNPDGRPLHTPHMTNPAEHGTKVGDVDWSRYGQPGYKAVAFNSTAEKRLREKAGVKQGGTWFHDSAGTLRQHSSGSRSRKAASAMIAKIPFELARHVASCWHPGNRA